MRTYDTYEQTLSYKQEKASTSGYMIAYNYLTSLPPAEGFMMVYLIEAEDICKIRLKEDTAFFECTYEFIQSKCSGWSRQNIITAMKNLKNRGLIEIKNVKIGNHEPRFIKLNHDLLYKMEWDYNMREKIILKPQNITSNYNEVIRF